MITKILHSFKHIFSFEKKNIMLLHYRYFQIMALMTKMRLEQADKRTS